MVNTTAAVNAMVVLAGLLEQHGRVADEKIIKGALEGRRPANNTLYFLRGVRRGYEVAQPGLCGHLVRLFHLLKGASLGGRSPDPPGDALLDEQATKDIRNSLQVVIDELKKLPSDNDDWRDDFRRRMRPEQVIIPIGVVSVVGGDGAVAAADNAAPTDDDGDDWKIQVVRAEEATNFEIELVQVPNGEAGARYVKIKRRRNRSGVSTHTNGHGAIGCRY